MQHTSEASSLSDPVVNLGVSARVAAGSNTTRIRAYVDSSTNMHASSLDIVG